MFTLILGQQWPASGIPGKQRGCRLASGNSSDFQRGKSHYRSSEKSLAVINHAIKGGRGLQAHPLEMYVVCGGRSTSSLLVPALSADEPSAMQIPYWEEMAGYSDWSQPYMVLHD